MSDTEPPPPYSLNVSDEWNQDSSIVQPQNPPLTPSASRPSLRSIPDPDTSPSSAPNPSPSSSSDVAPPTPVSATDMSSSTLPPSYFDLTTFGIGTKKIKRPLVTIAQVKSHLRLLRAFKLFQEKVEDLYSDPEAADVVPPIARSVGAKGRWLWFLEMAVERSACYSRLVRSIFFLCAHPLSGGWLQIPTMAFDS